MKALEIIGKGVLESAALIGTFITGFVTGGVFVIKTANDVNEAKKKEQEN